MYFMCCTFSVYIQRNTVYMIWVQSKIFCSGMIVSLESHKNHTIVGSQPPVSVPRLLTPAFIILLIQIDQQRRGRSMSRCEPPATESQHQGVKAAGPVGCVAGKTHPTWPGTGNPACASVHEPPGHRASRPLGSLQTSAIAEAQRELSANQRAAQPTLVPTSKRRKDHH